MSDVCIYIPLFILVKSCGGSGPNRLKAYCKKRKEKVTEINEGRMRYGASNGLSVAHCSMSEVL